MAHRECRADLRGLPAGSAALRDVGSHPLRYLSQALVDQEPQRLASCRPGDAVLLHQVSDRRQPTPRWQFPALNLSAQDARHLPVGRDGAVLVDLVDHAITIGDLRGRYYPLSAHSSLWATGCTLVMTDGGAARRCTRQTAPRDHAPERPITLGSIISALRRCPATRAVPRLDVRHCMGHRREWPRPAARLGYAGRDSAVRVDR